MKKGTYPYCRTNEALKRLKDGDVLQNLDTDEFFKQEGNRIFVSKDYIHWIETDSFIHPPYVEWKSVSNLHYLDDLEGESVFFLALDDSILHKSDPAADPSMKRWFTKGMPL